MHEPTRAYGRAALRVLTALVLALAMVPPAHASFLSGEAMATAANVLAIVVIVLVPIIGIAVFWLVHVLPEKIAHKRQHPQTEAIQVLCLLSLVFGGMLWPLAWLWAYSKPVLYKMAYGTDKLEDHGPGSSAGGEAQRSVSQEMAVLRAEIAALSARADSPRELAAIRDRLAALEPRLVDPAGEAR